MDQLPEYIINIRITIHYLYYFVRVNYYTKLFCYIHVICNSIMLSIILILYNLTNITNSGNLSTWKEMTICTKLYSVYFRHSACSYCTYSSSLEIATSSSSLS